MSTTMNREKRQRYLLMAAGVALTALLVAGFVFLLSQRREHARTMMEFEALQAAAALTEYYARSGTPDESVLPERVRGFGIYDGSGRARVQVGTAPAARQPLPPSAAPRSELYRGEGTLRLVRPLGVPRATRPGPMDRMPENMRERMQDRGMGPRGGMMQPPAQQPETRSVLGGATLLLVDYDVSHILAATRTRLASWSALGLALIGLLAAVTVLSHRLHLYEEDRRKREHLVQLGEAARTLAHEIRNPLGAIRLQTAMLRKRLGGVGTLPAGRPGTGAAAAPPGADADDRDGARIRVADRGPGLPADAAGEHVFDPFYTRKNGGFGVGLAVSKRFVEAAGRTLRETERATIEEALYRNEWRRQQTADELGITRRTLLNKIKDYGLEEDLS
jgi:hypothetical protein